MRERVFACEYVSESVCVFKVVVTHLLSLYP